ncbi:hypothetical protein FRC02_003448 [Tulasnella sp. 418]|nr:hypothetical protein FRC02_003448 [Tulasnella sp. 418]
MDKLQQWSWHQSHDQATVLLLVPAETDDVSVYIDGKYLIASVKGEPPAIKGRLYASVNTQTSSWQLERRHGRSTGVGAHHHPSTGVGKTRRRPTSTSASSESSYAVLTDPDISSSFAESLEAAAAGVHSDVDFDTDVEAGFSSPSESHDEDHNERRSRRRERFGPPSPQPPSPTSGAEPSLASSLSSSVHSLRPNRSQPTRLLTIHLEKVQAEIWPSLIVSGIPIELDASTDMTASTHNSDVSLSSSTASTVTIGNDDFKYNMDPTSLVMVGLHVLHDDQEDAFEYFCRAWHAAHNPIAAMKLVSIYLPLSSTPQRTALDTSPPASLYTHYLHRIGGNKALATLYTEAGILHIEGLGTQLTASTSSALSASPFSFGFSEYGSTLGGPDPDLAQRYFRRARALDPSIELPDLRKSELVMPSLDLDQSRTTVKTQMTSSQISNKEAKRRAGDGGNWNGEEDSWSYLYLPGLLGASVAVGIMGVISVTWWRNHNN